MTQTVGAFGSVLAVAALGLMLHAPSANSLPTALYKDPGTPVEQRVEDLLSRMSAREKAAMLSGRGWMETQPGWRLGIPAIKMADGPVGVRNWAGPSTQTSGSGARLTPVHATAFPVGTAMAATWDVALVEREGHAIAQEVKTLGRDMILGPTVNINRVPMWGRNFEGYGEDPYLTSRLGVAYIRGVQAEGVIATVKHFAANNQEFERHRIDEKIDERTLHEIYFPAFKAAVEEAGVWAVMSAYNKVNGKWCAENAYLLTDTLKRRWGFQGFVISDWGSTYSTEGTINAGMDLEMPGGEPMRRWIAGAEAQEVGNSGGWLTADKVLAAVASGKVRQARVDDAVRRMLRVMFRAGLFDHPHAGGGAVDTAEQKALARRAATETIVLLKNALPKYSFFRNPGGLLPLAAPKIHSLAVIGPNAAVARTGGGGSSLVDPAYGVSPLQGIKEAAGSQIAVSYAPGVLMEGEADAVHQTQPARDRLLQEAVAAAMKADAAVVVVGNSARIESEDFDLKSMNLPAGQDQLIQAIAGANKNTVVVIVAGSPVAMTAWIDRVPAVLDAWYGGQEAGHAIADVLFGVANPSGKLPVTFPREWKDSPAYGHYPGQNLHVDYAEGIYVGYRGFDKRNVAPLFPFGYGLSYTTFAYDDLRITPARVGAGQQVEVSLRVRNSGSRAGAEIVQLYLNDKQPGVDRPPKELKGFRRVTLRPGEAQTVSFTLDGRAMSFYSTAKKDWIAEPGAFEVLIGASSRDIRLKGGFELTR